MAGRIPQDFIDDLLARVNIIDVLDGRVEKLRRSGKNFSGLCPFHKENTPSFSANQEKQFYYCFGCGAGGNAISFLMEYERLDFPVAVEELAKMVGLEVPKEEESDEHRQKQKKVKGLYDQLEKASDFYQQQLRTHPDKATAINYLKGRGMSGQVAKAFGIGYAPQGWDNLLKHFSDTPNKDRQLTEAGMVIHNEDKDRYYDRFRDRIMFPIRDQRGRVIAFGGRVLGDEKPKYLNSPETETFHKSRELYGLYEARKHSNGLSRLLVVEGYMDVVGLAQYGIHYSVATLGTATTEQHLERMFKMVPEVVFCFDGDNAGRSAAARALDNALPAIEDQKDVRFLFLPDGEDPDSLVRREGTDAFQERINQSLALSDFFFKHYSADIDLLSMDGRARLASTVLPLIGGMKPSILKQMMLEKVKDITQLNADQLDTYLKPKETKKPSVALPISDRNNSANKARNTPNASSPNLDEAPPIDTAMYEHMVDVDYEQDAGVHYYQPENLVDSRAQKPLSKPQRAVSKLARGTLCDRLISLLFQYPALVPECQLPEYIDLLGDEHTPILIAIKAFFVSSPQASSGTLFIEWDEDPDKQPWLDIIDNVVKADQIEDMSGARTLLSDTLKQLNNEARKARLGYLAKLPQKSDSDKAELLELIRANL